MIPVDDVSTGYFDSSALVKRYIDEVGSSWVQNWCNQPMYTVAIAEIGFVEIAAAFARKLRGGYITQQAYQVARADLDNDIQNQYAAVSLDRLLINVAIELTARHQLRGYDAVHLASALRLNQALTSAKLPSLHFISADNDLLAAAEAEGLLTDNPNDHPRE